MTKITGRRYFGSAGVEGSLPLHSDAPEYWVVLEGRIRFEIEIHRESFRPSRLPRGLGTCT